MSARRSPVDWKGWLARWDRQQQLYLPNREARFAMMFGVVEQLLPRKFVAIDLACGPGSLTQRLLHRFPRARSVAVDFDPVLLKLGGEALRPLGARVRWIEADLRRLDWVEQLPEGRVDAVLTTTALHWLAPKDLKRLYRQLRRLLSRGGVMMNGDQMAYDASNPTFRRLARQVGARARRRRLGLVKSEGWHEWWARLAKEPVLHDLFEQRHRRFPREHSSHPSATLHRHEQYLRQAGFSEVGVIWQELDDRILLAVS